MTQDVQKNDLVLFDFSSPDQTVGWQIIDDVVMGGYSSSEFRCNGNQTNTAVFQGTVSLENNGGFASTRTTPRRFDLLASQGIRLRVKGDGKTYQFRLRTNDDVDGIAYRFEFRTRAGRWMVLDIPFLQCVPVFRGRILVDRPPISAEEIQQIGFMISGRQRGMFRLEIDWIKAYKQ